MQKGIITLLINQTGYADAFLKAEVDCIHGLI
jgi:hypothetical protein